MKQTIVAERAPQAIGPYSQAVVAGGAVYLSGQVGTLALILPILVLSKETIVPFMLLPLLTPLRKRGVLYIGLAAAAIVAVAGVARPDREQGLDALAPRLADADQSF